MIGNSRLGLTAYPLLALVALVAAPAHAYAGPGAGLSMIGSLVALVGAVLAGIFGFVWFPIKRLLKKRKASAIDVATPPVDPGDAPR